MPECEQDTTAVAVPTAESGRTTRIHENSSGARKRKVIHDYNFHCPCDRCEGRPPIAYKTVNNHLKRMEMNLQRNVNNSKLNENYVAKILNYNDRIQEFKATIKAGKWREIAVERNYGSFGDQGGGGQTATTFHVETETQCPTDDYTDMGCDYGDDYDAFNAQYMEIDGAPNMECQNESGSESQTQSDSDSEGAGEDENEEPPEFNDIIIESDPHISFKECTKPGDLSTWLLDTAERFIPSTEPQNLVGDCCVEMLRDMLRNKYAIQNIRSVFNIWSRYAPNMPSFNQVEAMVRKIGSPFKTFFTCASHHAMSCERGIACTERLCGKPKNIQIKSLKIMDILRRAMQDESFSKGLRYGPSMARGSDVTISSVWQSNAMDCLRNKFSEDMEMTDKYIPIVIEIFTDGFAPYNKSNYSIWCVLMRILNLPPELGKGYDYIYPLVMIDGPKEPESIDQYLSMVAKDIEDSCSNMAGTVYDAATRSQVKVKVFLLCSAQDTRALRLVAKHDETPSQYPCHMCKIKGENFKIGSGKGMQRVAYKISSIPNLSHEAGINHRWNHQEVVELQSWVQDKINRGATLSSMATERKGIRGICAFQSIEHFDLVNGFLFCAMHGIQNAASRAESNVLGKFDTEPLRKFLNLTEKPKWVMNKAPRDSQSRRDDPNRYSEKNDTQARNYVSFIRTPSGFHGDPSRLFRRPNTSKKREEENESNAAKIKASEWKDFALSGILCASMYFGGVDPAVVKAYDGLFYSLKKLCAPVVNKEEVQELDDHVMYQVMLELEKRLPITEMPFHLHSLYHLPQQVLHYGPLPDLWSFPFESKFKDMKGMGKKKNMPVASIASRISLEMAVRSIASVMDNHHRERDIELTCGMLSYSEQGMRLPQKCIELNPSEHRLVQIHIKNYYVSTDKFEAIVGHGSSWASLRELVTIRDLLHDMPSHDTSNIPTIIKQLARNEFDVFKYDKLFLLGIEIEHRNYVEQRKTKTDNSYLLLRPGGNTTIPSLARVEGIYRIEIPDERKEMPNITLDERVLLLVKEYTLDDLDPDLKQCGLQDVFLYSTDTPAVERLIEISCIHEQAFLSPDMRTIHGALGETAKFKSYLVHNKGSLRNVDLSRFSKEKPI